MMLDKLIQWALGNRALVLFAAGLLTLVGIHTARRMPVDVFPDLTAPTVTVLTEAPGMAPTEVEQLITLPIEAAVNGAGGVRRVRSATAVGFSVVWVEFEWDTDVNLARQTVAEKLATIAGSLPPEVARPVLAPQTSIMGEILFLAVTSERHSPAELRNYSETAIRRRLLAVPGVAQVTPIGGAIRQFQVIIAPEMLAARGLALDQVVRALAEANENVSAGILNERGQEWLVTGAGRLRGIADIAATVVTTREGVPTLVGDLGQVVVGEAPKRGEGSAMGQPAVILGIQKQPGVNTLELTRRLDAVLADVATRLPDGMRLRADLFRQADFISVAIHNVQRALIEGVGLVTLVVLLFLANFRATLITLTAIPLSLVTSVLVLEWAGAGINTMTLGGMAIAIGALVDDAVIDVENVFRRLREWTSRSRREDAETKVAASLSASMTPVPPLSMREREETSTPFLPAARAGGLQPPPSPTNNLTDGGGQPPAPPGAFQVVLRASIEIRSSIVFATLIIALVFVPLFFLSGIEGRLLQPLGVAYLVALLASLLVAVTVTPVLCLCLLPASRAVRAGHEPAFARWLKRGYEPVLRAALDHPWRCTLPALLLLILALASTTRLGRAFLPEFNEGSLTISAVTMPGTSLAESDALGRVVENILRAQPEVASVARRTGRAELDEHAQGVESSELEVSLRMKQRGKAEFLAALRAEFAVVPGLNVTIGQPISHRIDHMLSGTRANIAVKIFGPDLFQLRSVAEQTRRAMQGVPGVVDLSVDVQMEVPVLRVQFDRAACARHGLTLREVARTLEAAVQGTRATRVREDQNAFDLVVRLEGAEAWRRDSLGDLLVDTPGGAKVPLGALARILRDTGPNQVLREQVERKIVVQCNVAGRDVTGVVHDIQKLVNPFFAAAPGYRVEYSGQFESAAEAGRTLAFVGLGVILGIGFLLHLAFRSVRDTALIMLNLPLALIGGVAGVFVSGGVLSVASLIGFITVFGIATRNGIMLVSHIRHLQEREGVTDFREAVRRGAMERLVPILMTALAAGLALIPLALGGGQPGNEIQTPMAIVILCGLLTSMLLNMLIVPALYFRLGRPAQL